MPSPPFPFAEDIFRRNQLAQWRALYPSLLAITADVEAIHDAVIFSPPDVTGRPFRLSQRAIGLIAAELAARMHVAPVRYPMRWHFVDEILPTAPRPPLQHRWWEVSHPGSLTYANYLLSYGTPGSHSYSGTVARTPATTPDPTPYFFALGPILTYAPLLVEVARAAVGPEEFAALVEPWQARLDARQPEQWGTDDFFAHRYDLVTWLRLVNGTTTLDESGNVETVTDLGAVGGSYGQSNASLRPGEVAFEQGRAMSFDEDRLVSDAPTNALAALINATGSAIAGGAFRVSSLASTRAVWGCRANSAISPGQALEILTNGTIRIAHNEGGSTQFISSSSGAVETDTTYVWTIVKSGTSTAIRLNGSQVASGTINFPIDEHGAIAVGAYNDGGNPFDGLESELVVFAGSNLPDVEAFEAWLGRHPME